MITATATIILAETEARRLWRANAEDRDDDEAHPPVGQALADWVADFICTTLESNWQFDARVYADVKAGAANDTPRLIAELRDCDAIIGDSGTTPSVNAAKARRAEIKDELGLPDDQDRSEVELAELLAAYPADIED